MWSDLEPLLDRVFTAGETLSAKDRPFYIERHGVGETVYFDISYSAVREEDGAVGGLLCIVAETTSRVLAQQRMASERERLAQLFEQAPGFMALLEVPGHVFTLANSAYCRLTGNRPLFGRRVDEALPEVVGQCFVDLLDTVYRSGGNLPRPVRRGAIGARARSRPGSPFPELCLSADQGRTRRGHRDLRRGGRRHRDGAHDREPSRNCASRRRWRRSANSPAAARMISTTFLQAISGALDGVPKRLSQGRADEVERFLKAAEEGARRLAFGRPARDRERKPAHAGGERGRTRRRLCRA